MALFKAIWGSQVFTIFKLEKRTRPGAIPSRIIAPCQVVGVITAVVTPILLIFKHAQEHRHIFSGRN
ncbi:MAG: hypothetical protein IKZ45_08010, partial [Fibrobacter sp.]|nr:hypothetical protein [Fibrobacter sp.]